MNLINTLITNRGMEDPVTIIVAKAEELEVFQPSELAMLAWNLIKIAEEEDEFGMWEALLDSMVEVLKDTDKFIERVLPHTRQWG